MSIIIQYQYFSSGFLFTSLNQAYSVLIIDISVQCFDLILLWSYHINSF